MLGWNLREVERSGDRLDAHSVPQSTSLLASDPGAWWLVSVLVSFPPVRHCPPQSTGWLDEHVADGVRPWRTATVLEHIRHPPARPVINFTGIAGVYLGFWAETEHVAWLYVVCLILLLGAAAAQLRSLRPRALTTKTARSAASPSPPPGDASRTRRADECACNARRAADMTRYRQFQAAARATWNKRPWIGGVDHH
jgi:hypothetical protein